MRIPWVISRRAAFRGALGLLLAGCGSSEPENKPIPADEQSLKELAAVYRDFFRKNKRGPRFLKEIQGKGQNYPNAMRMLKSGELIVIWSAPLTTEGETAKSVLAYIKTVPESGGNVLLQDGTTIQNMSAEEFKAASKAIGR